MTRESAPNPFDEDELGPTRVSGGLSGKKAGEYVLGARIGQGAMGVVYRGMHPLLGREAAVKVLQTDSPDGAQKLLAEARAVAQARHPNIIDIFGFGTTEEGQPYFVMELLEGEALDLWLRSRPPLTPMEVVGILKQLFSGLAAAHAAHVIHRDLKPSNLFMARLADGTHFLKILDFGLSKQVDPDAPEKTLGTMVGTPLYMAPEQTIGQVSTPATDLYAAGCIAYELLVGRPPFSSPSLVELLRQQRETPPPPLPDALPTTLQDLVQALLMKVPSLRPASAAEVRQTLDRIERRIAAANPSGVVPSIPVAPPRPSRPPATKVARTSAERPTEPLPEVRPVSGNRRALSASQDRPTVKMEPLPMAPPPRSARDSVTVPAGPAATTVLDTPVLGERPRAERSKLPWVVGAIALVLVVALIAILLK